VFFGDDVVFVLEGGAEYSLPSHHWIRQNDQKPDECNHRFLALDGPDSDGNSEIFLLGDTFMNLYYTIFDR
jgi:hypothetical protein